MKTIQLDRQNTHQTPNVRKAEDLLAHTDIQLNGDRPWDIQVHNPEFYQRVLSGGSIALGESYMDGWWDCEAPDQFFHKLIMVRLDSKVIPLSWKINILKTKILNMQTKLKSRKSVEKHYEFSTDLFISFLDPYNQYTCAYFNDTDDLDIAQEKKLELICRKLMLSPKDKVLDIGCGWGGFAKFAAERYQCHVTGLTISDKQLEYAKKICDGLPVTIIKSDYRDYKGTHDKVLVCGMIEHVGYKNYKTLMQTVNHCLKEEGLFLLQTIGNNISVTTTDPWSNKYIFQNAVIPSAKDITTAAEGLFVLNDWHSFGAFYDKTLMAWHRNFKKNWNSIKDSYDDRFYRMWTFYLLSCAGSFRSNKSQLWQIVFSKRERKAGYQSLR